VTYGKSGALGRLLEDVSSVLFSCFGQDDPEDYEMRLRYWGFEHRSGNMTYEHFQALWTWWKAHGVNSVKAKEWERGVENHRLRHDQEGLAWEVKALAKLHELGISGPPHKKSSEKATPDEAVRVWYRGYSKSWAHE
jgi:hypothetical protein